LSTLTNALSSYYTSLQVDTLLSDYFDAVYIESNYYTISDIDNIVTTLLPSVVTVDISPTGGNFPDNISMQFSFAGTQCSLGTPYMDWTGLAAGPIRINIQAYVGDHEPNRGCVGLFPYSYYTGVTINTTGTWALSIYSGDWVLELFPNISHTTWTTYDYIIYPIACNYISG
jgi:hypothetical protein